MAAIKSARRGERGVTLVMVAIMLFMFLGMGALAIDYGMIKSAKTEAQRAADAAALAGASAFLALAKTDPGVVAEAQARAIDVATKNDIRLEMIQSGEVDPIDVVPDSELVRVTVTRASLNTWFANIWGITSVGVVAHATAHAAPAGKTPCVKPFALPDLWNERQRTAKKVKGTNFTGDTDGDHIWDQNETWMFDPAPGTNPDGTPGDTYAPYDPATEGTGEQTGYGSTFRDPAGCSGSSCLRDRGRAMTIKAQSPKQALGPGFFYLLRLQDSQGGNDIYNNIVGCAPGVFSTDSTYRIEDGNTQGPTTHGIEDVISSDPSAYWDPTADNGTGAVRGWNQAAYGSDWRGSPRVIKVGVFDPNQIANIQGGGNLSLRFNNVALMFLEGLVGSGQNEVVQARFLYYVSGTGDPGEEGAGGSLVKKLVLIK
jgi:hypothetical protein